MMFRVLWLCLLVSIVAGRAHKKRYFNQDAEATYSFSAADEKECIDTLEQVYPADYVSSGMVYAVWNDGQCGIYDTWVSDLSRKLKGYRRKIKTNH